MIYAEGVDLNPFTLEPNRKFLGYILDRLAEGADLQVDERGAALVGGGRQVRFQNTVVTKHFVTSPSQEDITRILGWLYTYNLSAEVSCKDTCPQVLAAWFISDPGSGFRLFQDSLAREFEYNNVERGILSALHQTTATYRDAGPNYGPYRRLLLCSTVHDMLMEDGYNTTPCAMPANGPIDVRVIPANDAAFFVAARGDAEAVMICVEGDFITLRDRHELWMFVNLAYGNSDGGCYARFNAHAAFSSNSCTLKNFSQLFTRVFILNMSLWTTLGMTALQGNAPYGEVISSSWSTTCTAIRCTFWCREWFSCRSSICYDTSWSCFAMSQVQHEIECQSCVVFPIANQSQSTGDLCCSSTRQGGFELCV